MENLMLKIKYYYRRLARPSVITINGIKIIARAPEISSGITRSLYKERYERHEIGNLAKILQPGDRLLDMGAGIGLTALNAAMKIGAENVIANEANPHLIKLMQRNFALNGKPIKIEHAVLSSKNENAETVPFYLSRNFWSSSLTQTGSARQAVEVPLRNIGSILKQNKISVINADIEGAEVAIFGNMQDFHAVRHILVETHIRYAGLNEVNRMIRNLMDHGFNLDLSRSHGERVLFSRVG